MQTIKPNIYSLCWFPYRKSFVGSVVLAIQSSVLAAKGATSSHHLSVLFWRADLSYSFLPEILSVLYSVLFASHLNISYQQTLNRQPSHHITMMVEVNFRPFFSSERYTLVAGTHFLMIQTKERWHHSTYVGRIGPSDPVYGW